MFHESQLAPAFVIRVRAIENLRTASDDESEVHTSTGVTSKSALEMTAVKIDKADVQPSPLSSPIASPKSAFALDRFLPAALTSQGGRCSHYHFQLASPPCRRTKRRLHWTRANPGHC